MMSPMTCLLRWEQANKYTWRGYDVNGRYAAFAVQTIDSLRDFTWNIVGLRIAGRAFDLDHAKQSAQAAYAQHNG